MLRVYCDTGAYVKLLGPLEAQGLIAVHQFKYENRSKRIRRGAVPSDLRYRDLANYTYDDLGKVEVLKDLTYKQLGGINSKFKELLEIVGHANRRDAQHLDSAQMTGCKVFLTSDKDDIWSNRESISLLTGLTVFHVQAEWDQFVAFVHCGR